MMQYEAAEARVAYLKTTLRQKEAFNYRLSLRLRWFEAKAVASDWREAFEDWAVKAENCRASIQQTEAEIIELRSELNEAKQYI